MYAKAEIRLVASDNDDYNPAALRPQDIEETYTITAPVAFQNYPVPIAPDVFEIGDGEMFEMVAYNRDDTNFITVSWRNEDATTGSAKIPAGRSIKIPHIDGDGSTQCSFVADTATCMIDVYLAK